MWILRKRFIILVVIYISSADLQTVVGFVLLIGHCITPETVFTFLPGFLAEDTAKLYY